MCLYGQNDIMIVIMQNWFRNPLVAYCIHIVEDKMIYAGMLTYKH